MKNTGNGIQELNSGFYQGKRVLVTGHTGFKGSWMSEVLLKLGAEVTGYALNPPTTPALFEFCNLQNRMNSVTGDIRDLKKLQETFDSVQPEIVIHMAAQPLVRESYRNPAETYEINVMGTVNVLECVRKTPSVKSFLNVTTDKVYQNKEWEWGYRENEELNGYDPYSNSKSCSELVTSSYRKSFFSGKGVAISTARAGNVIGGGDFAKDRIIPDCVRAALKREDIVIRNPYSVRPYQHVLEPVMAYLMIAMKQYEDVSYEGSYNIGPNEEDCIATGRLVSLFCSCWKQNTGDEIKWIEQYDGGPHEAGYLKLDCSRAKRIFGWQPRWSVDEAVKEAVSFYVKGNVKDDCRAVISEQINKYLS